MSPDSRPLILEIRYSHETIREICDRYLQALDRSQFRVETLILKGERAENFTADPIPTDRIDWLGFTSRQLSGNRGRVAKQVARVCEERQPAILLAHRFKAISVMASVCDSYHPKAAIGVMHGVEQLSGFRRRWYARRRLRDPIHLIGVSGAVVADLKRACGPGKKLVHCLPNCVDTDDVRSSLLSENEARNTLGLDADSFVVGTVARLVESKDQATLIRAFARVRQSREDALLVIVGDGPLRPKLEALAKRLGVGGSVIFPGWVDRAHRLLSAFDVFALTSKAEGFGIALAEAMAVGVPAVATDAGGIMHVLGSTGRLCQVGNDRQIASKILGIAELEPQGARLIGEGESTRVDAEFSLDVFAGRLNTLITLATTPYARAGK